MADELQKGALEDDKLTNAQQKAADEWVEKQILDVNQSAVERLADDLMRVHREREARLKERDERIFSAIEALKATLGR